MDKWLQTPQPIHPFIGEMHRGVTIFVNDAQDFFEGVHYFQSASISVEGILSFIIDKNTHGNTEGRGHFSHKTIR